MSNLDWFKAAFENKCFPNHGLIHRRDVAAIGLARAGGYDASSKETFREVSKRLSPKP